jgi:hypothetical protein
MSGSPPVDRSCATRSLKVARHLQRTRSDIVPAVEPLEGFASVLVGTDPSMKFVLREALAPGKVPVAGTRATGPLFAGSLVFAPLVVSAGAKKLSLSETDLDAVLKYAGMAVGPISTYARQYGPNALAVSATPIPVPASVPRGVFNDSTVQAWVDQLVAAHSLASDSTAVVVLNPPGPLNTDADAGRGILGYHGRATVPYAFVNVVGAELTLSDALDHFALALSHEIAELATDPAADLVNPEVCDPCGPSSQAPVRAYFDGAGEYLGSTAAFPPPFEYGFFLSAIVQPGAATQSPAPSSSCAYGPPKDPPAAPGPRSTPRAARSG